MKDNYMNVLEVKLKSGKIDGLGCCLTNWFVFLLNFVSSTAMQSSNMFVKCLMKVR